MGREHQRKYKKYEIWIRFKFYVHVYIECRIINNLRIEVNTQYKTREAVTVTGVGGWCSGPLCPLSLSLFSFILTSESHRTGQSGLSPSASLPQTKSVIAHVKSSK